MRIFLALILTCTFYFNAYADDVPTQDSTNSCIEVKRKDSLLAGWSPWEPYQIEKATSAGTVLTGMDIEIIKAIMGKIGLGITETQISWEQNLLGLQDGIFDLASGATYSDKRAKYAYFSIPYRFEVNSLMTLNNTQKHLSFSSIKEFLAQIRRQDYRLGVVADFVYASEEINDFLKDPANQDIVKVLADDTASLQALLRGDIDGFITDRVVGAAIIMANHASSMVREIPLHIQTPVHLMLSKKTTPLDVVEQINSTIANFVSSKEYKNIVKNYLYPTLLLQTIGSNWFYLLGVIGTIAFAISGVIIAEKDNTTLFGAFLFAFLPSLGGGIMRDIMLSHDQISLLLTPSYMYYVLIIVLSGFATMKLIGKYINSEEDSIANRIIDNTFVICDAVGQACFVVIGVTIAIMWHVEPIELWGPFCAFLTTNGGCIIRDCLRKNSDIMCLSGTIDAEVSLVWGAIFAMFLSSISSNPDPDNIQYAVYIVVVGSISTKLLTHYFKVQNLRFR
jgi:polar amino acid transport system substrate-binding protein